MHPSFVKNYLFSFGGKSDIPKEHCDRRGVVRRQTFASVAGGKKKKCW